MRRASPRGRWVRAVAVLVVLTLAAAFWLAREIPRESVDVARGGRSPSIRSAEVVSDPRVTAPAALAVPPVPETAAPSAAPGTRLLRVRVFESEQGVKADASSSVADVTVSAGVRLADASLGDPLATGTTDADGVCWLALPLDVIERERGEEAGSYWVRARRLGFLPREIVHVFPDRGLAPVEQLCRFTRGAEVRVRVVDAEGEPAPGEALLVKHESHPTGRERWSRLAADGTATLSATREGPQFVLARGVGERELRERNLPWFADDPFHAGVGRSGVFEVDWLAPPTDVIEVRLTNGGSLRGRVVDAHGAPAAGVVLRAELAGASAYTDDVWAARDSWLRARWAEGRGTPIAGTVTDGDGRFWFGGLCAERYHVFHASTRLTSEPVVADGRRLRFEVTRPHLVVRVTSRDAAAPPVIWPGSFPWRMGRGAPQDLPEGAHLVVLGADPATSDPRDARVLDTDALMVPVAEGGEYLVGVLAGDRQWRPVHVSVPAGATRVDVALELPAPVGSATLEITGVDHTGAPIQGGRRVTLEDLDSGLDVVVNESWSSVEDAWPVRLTLPAGRHCVRVGGAFIAVGHHGGYASPRVGAAEREVVLAPGETRRLTLEVGAGGRLRVRALGAIHADDRSFAEEHWGEGLPPERRAVYLDDWAGVVDLDLEEPGRVHSRLECELERPAPARIEGTLHRTFGVPLGEVATTNLVPAGTFTLVGRLPGGREARREVELFDGVTTDVTLDFR